MINLSNDQLKAFVQKHPVGVTCAALCLALAGYAYYASDDITLAEEELQKQADILERQTLNVTYSTHLKDQVDQLKAATAIAEKRLIKISALADNQRLFYRLESKTGVQLLDPRQLTTNAPAKAPGQSYLPVTFEVSIKGTYDRCLNFLRELESGGNYARINSVSMQPAQTTSPGEDAANTPLTMRLNLEILGEP